MDGPGAYATAKGLQPIGSIEPGTLVKSFDFACGKWVSGEVTKRHDNVFSGRIVRVQIGATAIEATAGHPFWVLAGEELEKRAVPPELHQSTDEGHALVGRWVSAVDLRPGDVVTGLDGDHRQISKVTVREDQAIAVSNLSIRGCRNYAVGPLAILVHNGDAFCDVYREALTRIGQAKKAVASSALVAASKAEGVAIHAHHIVLKTVSLSDWWKGRAPYIKRAQAVLEAVDIPLLDKLDNFCDQSEKCR